MRYLDRVASYCGTFKSMVVWIFVRYLRCNPPMKMFFRGGEIEGIVILWTSGFNGGPSDCYLARHCQVRLRNYRVVYCRKLICSFDSRENHISADQKVSGR
ncbi:uncharacterized protein [Macrobrachium rosenbergii]|uniref:uncharacterized protein n=1 Tax=Macrobrachium rosenbergii TaxID=79674 RepID=UPI0034D5C676